MEFSQILWLIFLMVGGLILMIKSADFFVDSAVKIAELSGIPKLIIGATLVSLATSLPELFVSTSAVLAGQNEMAIGNALGSVIFNTSVILSLAAIFMSGKVDRKNIIEKSMILFISLITLIIFILNDSKISLIEAIIQFSIVIVYTYLNVRAAKKQNERDLNKQVDNKGKQYLYNFIILVVSAVGIRYGAKFLVDGAEIIAKEFGMDETLIGLTILAIGTSLPELATTITAIVKKQQSLSVGNVLGANILNLTMIMGAAGILSNSVVKGGLMVESKKLFPLTEKVPQTLILDLPLAFIIIALFAIPIMRKGEIRKWQGIIGLIVYLAYFTYLVVNYTL